MKRNVLISSEKVIKAIENFFENEGFAKHLTSTELYVLRYALGGMKVNVNNPSLIKRIGLIDILSIFKSSKYVILSESNNFGLKIDEGLKDICSKLDERMIFLTYSHTHKGNYINQIYLYLPSPKDTQLIIPHSSVNNEDMKNLILDLERSDEYFFKIHIQNSEIVQTSDLDFSKEFFSFTSSHINCSTVTFHYVP